MYRVNGHDVCAEVHELVVDGMKLTQALATIAQLHDLSTEQCGIMTDMYVSRFGF